MIFNHAYQVNQENQGQQSRKSLNHVNQGSESIY